MPKYEDDTLTMSAWEQILELDTTAEDTLPAKDYFEQFTPADLFREGIDKRLCVLHYAGSMDDPAEKIDFLLAQFQKNGVPPVSKVTLTNWMTRTDKSGKASSPRTNQHGRENVFRLCFALEMDAVETARFMLKSYLCRPFNYKSTSEAVYFYCLSNGKTYADAQRIIESVKGAAKTASAETLCTEQIGQQLSSIRHESDLISHYYTGEDD